jgi:hypothetical protein
MESFKAFSSCIGSLVLFIALLVWVAFLQGLVIDRFYYWFVLPVFTGLPAITFFQAIGLSFFITLFKEHSYKEDEEGETQEAKYRRIAVGLLHMPILLLLGWITHLIIA